MRLNAAGTFLQSRVGRQLFVAFFFLVAIPVGAVSLLAYQLTEFIVRHSATQLSTELSKSIGLNLIDRLRFAENLLGMVLQNQGNPSNPALRAHLDQVFSSVDRLPPEPGRPPGPTALQVEEAGSETPSVHLELAGPQGRVRGRINPEYLWENVQSGSHRICFSGAPFAAPFCQGAQVAEEGAVVTRRDILFVPYFAAQPWTITTTHQPNVARYLPLGLAALVANVAGIAFLLALVGSSVLLRKLTRPLDALSVGTRAVLRGDFGQRVHIAGPRTEFTDLADSFNAMTDEVGRDLELLQALAHIDAAIMQHQSFEDVVRRVLLHLDAADFGGQLLVLQRLRAAPQVLALGLAPDGQLQHSPAAEAGPAADLPIGKTQDKEVWLRVGHAGSGRAERELAVFRQRLAVALQAEEWERQLRARATRDSLTGLLNRFGLVDLIDQLARGRPGQPPPATFAVVYLDLDGFKEINDAYGHDVGDRLLQGVAERLRTTLGNAPGIARLGGDEFVFVLSADPVHSFVQSAQAVLGAVRAPFSVPPRQLHVSASIGMALFPEHGLTHDDLLKFADLAMYSAKKAGRNRIALYDPAMNDEVADRLGLRRDLRGALDAGHIYVVYQPRVRGAGGAVVSVEALLRWHHPEKGFVSPDVFIALAEESGFIIELGRWVLAEALRQFQQWRQDPQHPVRQISVNLSPIQLADPALPGEIQAMLDQFGIRSGELELEVTEGALIRDVDAAVVRLDALRALGVAIALDDFGTGYSAMSYLSRLPFDTLKIDKSFVFAFEIERPALAIAKAIVALAKALDKRVVAEGVETPAQAALLEALGVDELQGFLYGKPQTAEALGVLWASTGAAAANS